MMVLGWLGIRQINNKNKWNKIKTKVSKQNNHRKMKVQIVNLQVAIKMRTNQAAVVVAIAMKIWVNKDYHQANLMKEHKWKTDKKIKEKWRSKDKGKKGKIIWKIITIQSLILILPLKRNENDMNIVFYRIILINIIMY